MENSKKIIVFSLIVLILIGGVSFGIYKLVKEESITETKEGVAQPSKKQDETEIPIKVKKTNIDIKEITDYLFTESDLLNVGFDTTDFYQKTTPFDLITEDLYETGLGADKNSPIFAIFFVKGNEATEAYNSSVELFEQYGDFNIENKNEYSDRSARGTASKINKKILFIQKGNNFLQFTYPETDESKVNELVQIGLNRIQ